jgi:hypothetical protein
MQEELRTTPHSRLSATLIRSDPADPWRVDFDQGQVVWPLFLEKFKLLATEAGRMLLEHPDNATDLECWMDRVFKFSQAEHPSYVDLLFSSGGGSIIAVCEASATLCTRLEREQIDLRSLGRHGVRDRELHKVVMEAVEKAFPSEPSAPLSNPPAAPSSRRQTPSHLSNRLPRTLTSPEAAKRPDAYLVEGIIGLNEFSIKSGLSERTIRTVRKTGKADRATFDSIAKAMNTTREQLLAPENRKDIGNISET